jgi:hypothetical protein
MFDLMLLAQNDMDTNIEKVVVEAEMGAGEPLLALMLPYECLFAFQATSNSALPRSSEVSTIGGMHVLLSC